MKDLLKHIIASILNDKYALMLAVLILISVISMF